MSDTRTVQEIIDDPAEDAALRQALRHNVAVRAIAPTMTLDYARELLRARCLIRGPELRECVHGALDARPITTDEVWGILRDSCIAVSRQAVRDTLDELVSDGLAGVVMAPPEGSLYTARHYYDREARAREEAKRNPDPFAGVC